jgi:hypothetical protein
VLRQTYQLMFDWGDELRRARVGAMYARFLVQMGQLDEAGRFWSTAGRSWRG